MESKSGEENAILASNSLTIRNADVTAKSYYPALFSGSTLEIADSTVKAESTADLGIWSKGSLAIKGDSDVVATGTSGSIGALTSATVTPTAGKKVEILVGNDRDSAAAVENSPFAGETDISAYKTNTYFRSKVKAVPPVGGGGTVMPNDNVTNNVTEKTTTADITTTSERTARQPQPLTKLPLTRSWTRLLQTSLKKLSSMRPRQKQTLRLQRSNSPQKQSRLSLKRPVQT